MVRERYLLGVEQDPYRYNVWSKCHSCWATVWFTGVFEPFIRSGMPVLCLGCAAEYEAMGRIPTHPFRLTNKQRTRYSAAT